MFYLPMVVCSCWPSAHTEVPLKISNFTDRIYFAKMYIPHQEQVLVQVEALALVLVQVGVASPVEVVSWAEALPSLEGEQVLFSLQTLASLLVLGE